MSDIKVLLVHEYELARRGLRRMLEDYEDIEVIGEAANALEAIDLALAVSPDVILMNAELPHVSGLEAIRILKERGYPGGVIVLSIDVEQLDSALRLGAGGYLVADAQGDELVSAIRRVPGGGFVFGASLMKTPQGQEMALRYLAQQRETSSETPRDTATAQAAPEESTLSIPEEEVAAREQPDLTSAEQIILDLLGSGANDKMIAARLVTTEDMVKTRLTILLRKLRMSNRAQAVAYARQLAREVRSDTDTAETRAIPEERALVEQTISETAPGMVAPPQGATGPSGPTPAAMGTVVTEVELVLSPPVEPTKLLRLHRWLTEDANMDVGEMTGSWTGDTLIRATIRQPIPLVWMLTELPDVESVTEESYTDSGAAVRQVIRSQAEMLWIGGRRTLPKRFRLVLKS